LIDSKLSLSFTNVTSIFNVDFDEYKNHSNNSVAASISVSNNASISIKNDANDLILIEGSQQSSRNNFIEFSSPSLDSINSALSSLTIKTDASRMPSITTLNVSAKIFSYNNYSAKSTSDTRSISISYRLGGLPILKSVDPSSAPSKGDLYVSLRGKHFGPIERIFKCIFSENKIITEAKRIERNESECEIPQYEVKLTYVFIEDEFGLKSNQIQFSFTESIILDQLNPTFGSEEGGTMVKVQGKNFSNSLDIFCVFDSLIYIKAIYISSTVIQFITPPSNGLKIANLSVSDNFIHESETRLQFSYVKPVIIYSIPPHFGFIKNENGKRRTLKIKGENIVDSDTLLCRFDETIITDAQYFNPSEIQCQIPSYEILQ